MNIKTKYDIGQKLYFLEWDTRKLSFHYSKIIEIRTQIRNRRQIWYYFEKQDNFYEGIPEANVFLSEESARKCVIKYWLPRRHKNNKDNRKLGIKYLLDLV